MKKTVNPDLDIEYEVEDACDVPEDSVFILVNGEPVRLEVADDVEDDQA